MTRKSSAIPKPPSTVFSQPVAMLTLGGLFAANAVSLDVPIIAIPAIAEQFGVTSGQAQMVTILFLLGFALGHIPMGLLSDRFGRKPVIIWGLITASLMSVIAILAPTFEVLMASRFIQGVSTCAGAMLARAMVRDVASGTAASKLNSKALSYLAVLIVVMPLLSGLILQFSNWRWVLALVAVYVIAVLLMTWFFVPETMHTDKHNGHPWAQFISSLKSFFATKQSMIASLLGGLAFGTYFIFVNVGSSMIVDVYNLPAASFALIFALSAALQFSASLLNTKLVETQGTQFVLRLALTTCVMAITMCVFWIIIGLPSLVAVIGIAFCFTITHGLVLPNSIALALDPLPKTAGFAAAIHGMLQTGLAALIGLIASSFYDGQIVTVLYLFAILGSVTLLCFFACRGIFKEI